MAKLRLVIWGLVVLAALGFGSLLLFKPAVRQGETTIAQPGFTLGGPFTLTGSDGQAFGSRQLAGKPYALFFGFTNCPDVCPNTLGRLAKLRSDLGKGDDAFRIVFVSVDPKRDTPKVVGDYVQLFGTPIIGLTGSEAQVAAVAKQHGIYQKVSPDAQSSDGYTVDHGAQVLLFGKDGKFVSTLTPEESLDVQLAKLERITA